jgi:uncharacterized protein
MGMKSMTSLPRLYDAILATHFASFGQMALVSGPRQVGKTTSTKSLSDSYLNWDNLDHRELILSGPSRVASSLGLDQLRSDAPIVTFDELHKFPKWKQFIKGFYDTYGDEARLLVTGSSRLDVYQKIGDSLMGRYFLYRMHPFSIAECIDPAPPTSASGPVRQPREISQASFAALWEHGGFPEPFSRRDVTFTRRWNRLRTQQLIKEDVRDYTQIKTLDQLEILITLLLSRSGEQIVYSNLAREVSVSVDTIKRWISDLCDLHVGFLLRPWHRNVARSLRKEPKWFLRDWSGISDPGKRAETFVACHLLKAVEGWNDLGLGTFQLGYLRNTSRQEVDFVVIRDDSPWFLVEVKQSSTKLAPNLERFRSELDAPFAFQAVLNLDPVAADCFQRAGRSLIVPAKTLLSQLL